MLLVTEIDPSTPFGVNFSFFLLTLNIWACPEQSLADVEEKSRSQLLVRF